MSRYPVEAPTIGSLRGASVRAAVDELLVVRGMAAAFYERGWSVCSMSQIITEIDDFLMPVVKYEGEPPVGGGH